MSKSGLRLAAATVAGLAVLAAGGALYLHQTEPKPAAGLVPKETGRKTVSLYCQFYVFVESRPFVAFLLERVPDTPGLYRQAYVAKADGDRTDYNALVGKPPQWRLDASGEPRRLEARVTVPDTSQAGLGEQDIAIELPGFDPERVSETWSEASLRSVYYQNLPGKCRQSVQTDPAQRAG